MWQCDTRHFLLSHAAELNRKNRDSVRWLFFQLFFFVAVDLHARVNAVRKVSIFICRALRRQAYNNYKNLWNSLSWPIIMFSSFSPYVQALISSRGAFWAFTEPMCVCVCDNNFVRMAIKRKNIQQNPNWWCFNCWRDRRCDAFTRIREIVYSSVIASTQLDGVFTDSYANK